MGWIGDRGYEFGIVDGGVELFGGLDPLSVEVSAWEVAAVVADDDAVDVQHGYDFEDEVLAQHAGGGAVAQQKVDNILYNKAAHCLTRMNPCC